MNARQAKELTDASVERNLIGQYLDRIHMLIEAAARQGHYLLDDPFSSFNPRPSFDTQEAIAKALRCDGFTVVKNQQLNTYVQVSWKF